MKYNANEFYPTPETLLDKVLAEVKWYEVGTILEPSAGKGDIAEYCRKKLGERYGRYRKNSDYDIDCIELDYDLRSTLIGKEFRVVHDNFLTFNTYKCYDLIIMNPPFSHGAKHLLHALSIAKNGCGIICLLNAETLKNPCTNERKELVKKLTDLKADIEYLTGEFENAERKTDVEIAVVKVVIPKTEKESVLVETLRRQESYTEKVDSSTDIVVDDYIEAAVAHYNFEVALGVKMFDEYEAMKPYLLKEKSELSLSLGRDVSVNVNDFIKHVRAKYWETLFNNERFTGNMTSDMLSKYREKIGELKNYDFSYYNIKTIQEEVSRHLIKGIEDCIIKLFDDLSREYAYDESLKNNIHYYNGWKTNKSWYINKKVILPYMNAFSDWSSEMRVYNVLGKLSDIEKALNYLDGGLTDARDLRETLKQAFDNKQTRKIDLKYFYATFYKKGTCHIEFKNDELLKKFNIFGSQQKGWLPQGYGKRKYKDMSKEEREVIDSFEGEKSYKAVLDNQKYYIYDPVSSVKMIEEVVR